MHKTTIKDIARKTGTSVASVHRALHGSKGVGEDLRQRILEEAHRSDYRVDESASLLRRSGISITVLLPKAEGNERFYYAGLWQGIRRAGERLGKIKASVRMVETAYGPDDIADALEHLYDESFSEGYRMDGLITICDDERAGMWITRFIRRGVQVALVDRGMPIPGLTCSAKVPVADMGRLAMELGALYYDREGMTGPVLLVNGARDRHSCRVYSRALQEKMEECWPERKRPALIEVFSEEEKQLRRAFRQVLEVEHPAVVVAASARTTFWVCDELELFALERKNRGDLRKPPVIGTDVFPELAPFFESGTLKAAIYQSHLISGEHCMDFLFDRLLNPEKKREQLIREPLFVVMRDNFPFFMEGKGSDVPG